VNAKFADSDGYAAERQRLSEEVIYWKEQFGIRGLHLQKCRDENQKLKDEIDLLRQSLKISRGEVQEHQQEENTLRSQGEADRRRSERRIADLLHEQAKLIQEAAFLRLDNEKLRNSIVTSGTALNPIHDEDHYVHGFEELKADLEMWVVRHTRGNSHRDMSNDEASNFYERLAALGPHGKDSSSFLRTNSCLEIWIKQPRTRFILFQHIIAMFLLEQVFAPFAIGLSASYSDALLWATDSLLAQGNSVFTNGIDNSEEQFGKILTIRQSLTTAALRETQPHVDGYQTKIVFKLAQILSALLTTTEDDIASNITKLVSKAVSLKIAMTKEVTIYRCYWVGCGERFNSASMEAGDSGTGNVCLCTFPGLDRTFKESDRTQVFRAIKAKTVFQSTMMT
jgi:hypothetical protein